MDTPTRRLERSEAALNRRGAIFAFTGKLEGKLKISTDTTRLNPNPAYGFVRRDHYWVLCNCTGTDVAAEYQWIWTIPWNSGNAGTAAEVAHYGIVYPGRKRSVRFCPGTANGRAIIIDEGLAMSGTHEDSVTQPAGGHLGFGSSHSAKFNMHIPSTAGAFLDLTLQAMQGEASASPCLADIPKGHDSARAFHAQIEKKNKVVVCGNGRKEIGYSNCCSQRLRLRAWGATIGYTLVVNLADMCIRHNTFPWVDVRLTEAWPFLKSLPHQLKIHRSVLRSLDGYLCDGVRLLHLARRRVIPPDCRVSARITGFDVESSRANFQSPRTVLLLRANLCEIDVWIQKEWTEIDVIFGFAALTEAASMTRPAKAKKTVVWRTIWIQTQIPVQSAEYREREEQRPFALGLQVPPSVRNFASRADEPHGMKLDPAESRCIEGGQQQDTQAPRSYVFVQLDTLSVPWTTQIQRKHERPYLREPGTPLNQRTNLAVVSPGKRILHGTIMEAVQASKLRRLAYANLPSLASRCRSSVLELPIVKWSGVVLMPATESMESDPTRYRPRLDLYTQPVFVTTSAWRPIWAYLLKQILMFATARNQLTSPKLQSTKLSLLPLADRFAHLLLRLFLILNRPSPTSLRSRARELRQIGLSVTVVGRRLRQSPLRLASPKTLSPGPPHGPCMTVVISPVGLSPDEAEGRPSMGLSINKVLSASLVSFRDLTASQIPAVPIRTGGQGDKHTSKALGALPVLDTRPFAMDPNNGKANGLVGDGPPADTTQVRVILCSSANYPGGGLYSSNLLEVFQKELTSSTPPSSQMKRRDGGAAHPFDAAVIPRRLTRRRCLLEEFWKPSPLGLASISWLHARATRPPHALNFAPGLDAGNTPFWPLLPSSDVHLSSLNRRYLRLDVVVVVVVPLRVTTMRTSQAMHICYELARIRVTNSKRNYSTYGRRVTRLWSLIIPYATELDVAICYFEKTYGYRARDAQSRQSGTTTIEDVEKEPSQVIQLLSFCLSSDSRGQTPPNHLVNLEPLFLANSQSFPEAPLHLGPWIEIGHAKASIRRKTWLNGQEITSRGRSNSSSVTLFRNFDTVHWMALCTSLPGRQEEAARSRALLMNECVPSVIFAIGEQGWIFGLARYFVSVSEPVLLYLYFSAMALRNGRTLEGARPAPTLWNIRPAQGQSTANGSYGALRRCFLADVVIDRRAAYSQDEDILSFIIDPTWLIEFERKQRKSDAGPEEKRFEGRQDLTLDSRLSRQRKHMRAPKPLVNWIGATHYRGKTREKPNSIAGAYCVHPRGIGKVRYAARPDGRRGSKNITLPAEVTAVADSNWPDNERDVYSRAVAFRKLSMAPQYEKQLEKKPLFNSIALTLNRVVASYPYERCGVAHDVHQGINYLGKPLLDAVTFSLPLRRRINGCFTHKVGVIQNDGVKQDDRPTPGREAEHWTPLPLAEETRSASHCLFCVHRASARYLDILNIVGEGEDGKEREYLTQERKGRGRYGYTSRKPGRGQAARTLVPTHNRFIPTRPRKYLMTSKWYPSIQCVPFGRLLVPSYPCTAVPYLAPLFVPASASMAPSSSALGISLDLTWGEGALSGSRHTDDTCVLRHRLYLTNRDGWYLRFQWVKQQRNSYYTLLIRLPLFVPAYPNDIQATTTQKPNQSYIPYHTDTLCTDSTRRLDVSTPFFFLADPFYYANHTSPSGPVTASCIRTACAVRAVPLGTSHTPPPFLPLFLPFFHLPPGPTKRIVSVVDIFITPAEPRPSVPVCAPLAASQLLFPSPFPLALCHTTHTQPSTLDPHSALCTPTPTPAPTRQLATQTPKSQGPTLHYHLAPSSHLDFLLHTYSYPSFASAAPTKLRSTVLSFFFFIFVPFLHFLATGNVPISNPRKRNSPTPTDIEASYFFLSSIPILILHSHIGTPSLAVYSSSLRFEANVESQTEASLSPSIKPPPVVLLLASPCFRSLVHRKCFVTASSNLVAVSTGLLAGCCTNDTYPAPTPAAPPGSIFPALFLIGPLFLP
ncbi:hypothetical protein CCUS01_01858 [Colletotrichum cuscutae]|uniref:Uncharacterized protein n=1 Tax=Colletotrichum cuscutae TaxID=1209917 RepID=A0AAI9U6X4_9PEZI|nr:hypothetical protein CCUS01_01858 [Colletotrichum cuscutae]